MCYSGCIRENYHGQCCASAAQLGKYPAHCYEPPEEEEETEDVSHYEEQYYMGRQELKEAYEQIGALKQIIENYKEKIQQVLNRLETATEPK